MQGKSKLDPIKDDVILYYLDGHSLAESSQYFNVGQATIYRFLKKHGVQIRSRQEGTALKGWTEERRQARIELYTGQPSKALGKRWTVGRVIKRPGLRGENNPQWRGGLTPLNIAIRDTPEYRFWRKEVFERDNYTCLICGVRSGKGNKIVLNADHIKPFSTLLRDYSITSIDDAISCTHLWDVNNGRTLCEPCHRQTDTYGLNLIYYS